MISFGEHIKSLRKNNYITQEAVAKELNVTSNTVANWESNRSKPLYHQIEPLATLFRVSVDGLLHSLADTLAGVDEKLDEMLIRKLNIKQEEVEDYMLEDIDISVLVSLKLGEWTGIRFEPLISPRYTWIEIENSIDKLSEKGFLDIYVKDDFASAQTTTITYKGESILWLITEMYS